MTILLLDAAGVIHHYSSDQQHSLQGVCARPKKQTVGISWSAYWRPPEKLGSRPVASTIYALDRFGLSHATPCKSQLGHFRKAVEQHPVC